MQKYKNPALSPDERAVDLLSLMTIDEKIDQMIFFSGGEQLLNEIKRGKKPDCRCGIFGNLSDFEDKNAITVLQDYFTKETRLGIPLLMTYESLHGLFDKNATAFPQCAGLGGTFDKELIGKMAKIIGNEGKGLGYAQLFAPNIDIPRDPRWGRIQEAYGEDPYLVGEMGAEYIKKLQSAGVAATAKHFIAYGIPEGGLNLSPVHIGEREVREVMLEPFKKCIDAGVLSVMPSYNEVDGEPLHSSQKYMRDILRDELKFDGTVISDFGAVDMLHTLHRVAATYKNAGEMALNAGIDIEAPFPNGYCEEFRNDVKEGIIDIKLIDECVLHVLKLKFSLGLFENPYPTTDPSEVLHTESAVELSREMDEKSILLLKNDGILPLDESKIGKLAVIGNNAKYSYLGNYIGYKDNCVSFYDGMVNRLGADRVLYAKGCNHITTTDEMLREAVEAAKSCDTVMLVLGDSSDTGGSVGGGEFSDREITCGEGYDRTNLTLTPSQQRLFDEILKLNKPTVLIMYVGRPHAIKEQVDKVNGFMMSWGGGEQNGNAFASLIFGDKSPSAKLTFSLPQSVGHIPCYYNYKISARGAFYKRPGTKDAPGRDYVFSSPEPWLPFGYGLSYTDVRYSSLKAVVLENGAVNVSVDIENAGNYEIDESVLLYVKMMYCPITPFVKKLRRFEKVNLKIGEKKTVHFTLCDEDFAYINKDMKTVKNKGEHKILIESLEATINI